MQELEAELSHYRRNSTNSSNPPSSDPPSVERRPTLPSGRKPGGQPGHKGHRRELLPVEKVDHLAVLKPERCGGCKAQLVGDDPAPVRHQVIDLPPIKPRVSEYQLHRLVCPHCGAATRAELPSDVPRTGFGVQVCALVTLLTGKCHLSKRTARELCKDGFGLDLGLGSISHIEQAMSEAVAPAVEEARAHVRAEAVVHPDETSWREARKKAWLWTAATKAVTVFQIDKSRGGDVARALLGEPFGGTAVSDRWAGYNWIPVEQRQICLAHLRRDFQDMEDRGGQSAWIGTALLAHLKRIFRRWKRVRDGTMSREQFEKKTRSLQRYVGTDLRLGTWYGDAKTAGVCAEILKLEPALWSFAHRDGVEPTNNRAERAIRPAVLWRKGSFGTHSPQGSRFVERILTVVATLKQQGRNVLDYLVAAYKASLANQPTPSLLPAR